MKKEKQNLHETYEWNGEKIRYKVAIDDQDIDPKDLLHQLDITRNKINQMETQKIQMENQIKLLAENIGRAKDIEKQSAEFEEKCREIQKDKLDLFIRQIQGEAFNEAEEEAMKIISKDPSGYTAEQIVNQKYVIFQQKLARNPKVAERIAPGIIRDYIYDTPIFENPFK